MTFGYLAFDWCFDLPAKSIKLQKWTCHCIDTSWTSLRNLYSSRPFPLKNPLILNHKIFPQKTIKTKHSFETPDLFPAKTFKPNPKTPPPKDVLLNPKAQSYISSKRAPKPPKETNILLNIPKLQPTTHQDLTRCNRSSLFRTAIRALTPHWSTTALGANAGCLGRLSGILPVTWASAKEHPAGVLLGGVGECSFEPFFWCVEEVEWWCTLTGNHHVQPLGRGERARDPLPHAGLHGRSLRVLCGECLRTLLCA